MLMLTKMVAVFRPGSWSCGRNTDIAVAGRTAALAVRALISNHREAHLQCTQRVTCPFLGFRGAGPLKGTAAFSGGLFQRQPQALGALSKRQAFYFTPRRKKVSSDSFDHFRSFMLIPRTLDSFLICPSHVFLIYPCSCSEQTFGVILGSFSSQPTSSP